MKENNKYLQGEKICKDLFQKTGDVRFHNMMNGFKQLERESEMNEQNQREM